MGEKLEEKEGFRDKTPLANLT